MSLAMTKDERERFLAALHVGVISMEDPGRGPLSVPIWYSYQPGGELWVITDRDSRKGKLLAVGKRISLVAQTETAPYQYVSVEGPIVTVEPLASRSRHAADRRSATSARSSGASTSRRPRTSARRAAASSCECAPNAG